MSTTRAIQGRGAPPAVLQPLEPLLDPCEGFRLRLAVSLAGLKFDDEATVTLMLAGLAELAR